MDIQVLCCKKFTAIFESMNRNLADADYSFRLKTLLLQHRWPWHAAFWVGYILFRFWPYYITLNYYSAVFLEYMLLSEILFVLLTYFTVWLYRRLFETKKLWYFLAGTLSWLAYLYLRTVFQFYYLRNEPGFKGASFVDMFVTNITAVMVFFLFITACKYVKDSYIAQQLEAEKKSQQLLAEVNNLKSQIAPHFLFNTLNNLYGLAVEKSDKLPALMLRLSSLLRHSLYETQKPLVKLGEEMNMLKSYVDLESLRLEDDLKLKFDNKVPHDSDYLIAPLILIVFMENAFKHAKSVRGTAVEIYIQAALEENTFQLTIRNNFNEKKQASLNGIGLTNVKRRLEVLYPDQQHTLTISSDTGYYLVSLQLQLEKFNESLTYGN
jgi:two-component system sensor histidine kinase LytS